MAIQNDAEAIQLAQVACGMLGEVAEYWHTAHPTFSAVKLHVEASDLGERLEQLTGATAGSMSLKPLDGTPKQ